MPLTESNIIGILLPKTKSDANIPFSKNISNVGLHVHSTGHGITLRTVVANLRHLRFCVTTVKDG
jgi:hypothetical protein